MSVEEAAEVLGVHPNTVIRDWGLAKAWLKRELSPKGRMEVERWNRIEELYQAALALPPERRAAFLARACSADPQLRAEVQSLLDQQADSFLEGAPVSAIKTLRPGVKLSNFEIVELSARAAWAKYTGRATCA